jgi:ATP-binding cassette, subfamily B, bacterial
MFAMQAITIVALVAEILVARSLLSHLLGEHPGTATVSRLVPQVIALGVLTAVLGVANAVQLHRQRILAELCARHGDDQVLAVTASVELVEFEDPSFHDSVERAQAAVRMLPPVVSNLGNLLRALAIAVGATIALIVVAPLFAPVAVLILAPLFLASRRRARVSYRFAKSMTPLDRERRYLAQVLADRDAAKEVRAFELPAYLKDRHGRLWEVRLRELRRMMDGQLNYTLIATLFASVALSGIMLAIVSLTLSDDVSLASAGAVAGAMIILARRLGGAASATGGLSEAALHLHDYLELAARAPAASESPTAGPPLTELAVHAESVSFAYPGEREAALHEVSIEVAPGQVVALVGENGSGKTTLAKVLAGLYEPESGRVLVNGREAAGDVLDVLRGNVAVIFQDYQRYALPAQDNIGLGRHERLPDPEGVREAASITGIDGVLERLPDGYETMLGPAFAGGTDLSMGQWQRVALSRALYREAPFVILDEPTAALDPQAEHEIFSGIRNVLDGRGVLLITHRFATVRTADRIYVMDGGRIVEEGTHDELIAAAGRYASMFAVQAAPYR